MHNLAHKIFSVDSIRIITINTWKCDGDYHARMRILAQQLQLLQPHIIACQECFLSEEAGADTLRFLAGRLDMNFAFVSGRTKKRYFEEKWVDSQSGLGILSVYPVFETKEYPLPAVPGDEDRKVQQAVIFLPDGKKLQFTNTHLTHLRDFPGLKEQQARSLAEAVTEMGDSTYSIICGDFNSVMDSANITTFIHMANAIDCYAAGNGTEPRYSLVEQFERDKKICVDHIFALAVPATGKYPGFRDSGIVLNTAHSGTGLYPSDHFGITTTLILN